ncbi:hypothetical protein BD410DRAFT_846898, partial [Rickenella mellea]
MPPRKQPPAHPVRQTAGKQPKQPAGKRPAGKKPMGIAIRTNMYVAPTVEERMEKKSDVRYPKVAQPGKSPYRIAMPGIRPYMDDQDSNPFASEYIKKKVIKWQRTAADRFFPLVVLYLPLELEEAGEDAATDDSDSDDSDDSGDSAEDDGPPWEDVRTYWMPVEFLSVMSIVVEEVNATGLWEDQEHADTLFYNAERRSQSTKGWTRPKAPTTRGVARYNSDDSRDWLYFSTVFTKLLKEMDACVDPTSRELPPHFRSKPLHNLAWRELARRQPRPHTEEARVVFEQYMRGMHELPYGEEVIGREHIIRSQPDPNPVEMGSLKSIKVLLMLLEATVYPEGHNRIDDWAISGLVRSAKAALEDENIRNTLLSESEDYLKWITHQNELDVVYLLKSLHNHAEEWCPTMYEHHVANTAKMLTQLHMDMTPNDTSPPVDPSLPLHPTSSTRSIAAPNEAFATPSRHSPQLSPNQPESRQRTPMRESPIPPTNESRRLTVDVIVHAYQLADAYVDSGVWHHPTHEAELGSILKLVNTELTVSETRQDLMLKSKNLVAWEANDQDSLAETFAAFIEESMCEADMTKGESKQAWTLLRDFYQDARAFHTANQHNSPDQQRPQSASPLRGATPARIQPAQTSQQPSTQVTYATIRDAIQLGQQFLQNGVLVMDQDMLEVYLTAILKALLLSKVRAQLISEAHRDGDYVFRDETTMRDMLEQFQKTRMCSRMGATHYDQAWKAIAKFFDDVAGWSVTAKREMLEKGPSFSRPSATPPLGRVTFVGSPLSLTDPPRSPSLPP